MKKESVFALLDCNNFFVSCEKVFRPDLEGKPVAVLSNNDGIIIARSNEVKELGVPMAEALHKVKDLLKAQNTTLFSANFKLYGDISRRIVEIAQQYSPDVEVYSIDEMFIDLSLLNVSDYSKLIADMRAQILKWVGVPVSIGIAPSKTLAKAASEYAKKHPETGGSFSAMAEESVRTVLEWLPVGDVWGIGFRWTPKLTGFGVKTANQFINLDEKWVYKNMSVRGLRTWKELRGESCIPLLESVYVDQHKQKSMTTTRLFGDSINSLADIEMATANHTARIASKLRRRKQITWDIAVYIQTKSKPHKTTYKQLKLPYPTADTALLITYAHKAVQQIYDKEKSYRRVGVYLSELAPDSAQQLSIINGPSMNDLKKTDSLMKTIDLINKNHGAKTIGLGSQGVNISQNWHSRRKLKTPDYTTNWMHIPVAKV